MGLVREILHVERFTSAISHDAAYRYGDESKVNIGSDEKRLRSRFSG